MNQQLHATLADPVLGIPAQLQPVLAHFGSAGSPRSVAGWLTGMPGGMLLAALAATAHHRELTHALLDEQPQTSALHYVRDMLVQAGVLPPRDEYLERIEPWLGEVLAGRPAQHAALVRPYATWHVLRRARRRCRGTSTMSAAGWARGRILAALAFLAWLDDRGTALGTVTQADVDDWLHGATRYRYLLRDFLAWASARRLAGEITVPALPPSELNGLISEDSRWQLLGRCLRDPGIPLDVRTAGALLLLYGQFVSRLTRLTAADVEQHGPDTCLRLDTVPVLLPPRLAALVRAQIEAAPDHPGPRPLFPGRSPARPVAPQTLTRRLRQHGIEPRQARNTALAAWASELPPAVLASLLGVHIQTAVNWASRTRRDWTTYLAERISPGGARPPPGKSACSASVQAAHLGGDGHDVDRPGCVHGDQRADADRPVVLVHIGQRRRLQPVDLVPRRSGVVAGDRDLGRARAVHLDDAVAETAQLVQLQLTVRVEVGLDHHVARAGRERPQQLKRRSAKPQRPCLVDLAVARHEQGVVQCLLDQVLRHQRIPELRRQRHGKAALPRPQPPRDVRNPAHPAHPGTSERLPTLDRAGPVCPVPRPSSGDQRLPY
jgi:hypothetical protein